MARLRIFISYSHVDRPYFDEFRRFLRPYEERGDLEVWTDDELEVGDRVDGMIEKALDRADLGILLVSINFLTSRYVQEKELPKLLDESRVTCLHVGPTNVDDEGLTFRLADGKDVRLTDFKNLNEHERPVNGIEREGQRQVVYRDAVKKLLRLARRNETPRPKETRDRAELTVRLDLESGLLHHVFLGPHGVIDRPKPTRWSDVEPALTEFAVADGEALYRTLLGSDDARITRVLKLLFHHKGEPNPTFAPLRVRVQTNDPLLLALAWSRVSWQGERLVDSGWTFELVLPDGKDRAPVFGPERVDTPPSVLLIGPEPTDSMIGTAAHVAGLQRILNERWPDAASLTTAERRFSNVIAALGAPRRWPIVYVYARARRDAAGLRLLFEDAGGHEQPRSLREIAGAWGEHPPRVLFLNLIGAEPVDVIDAVRFLHPTIPLVVVQTSPHHYTPDPDDDPRHTAERWLGSLIAPETSHDPIGSLHRLGRVSATAFTAYSELIVPETGVPVPPCLARFLLDRKLQRGSAGTTRRDLLDSKSLRVSCQVGYGDESNLTSLLATQILHHLDGEGGDGGTRHLSIRIHVRRPDDPLRFSANDLEAELLRGLGLGPTASVKEGLRKLKPRSSRSAITLVLIDWGVHGGSQAFELRPGELLVWAKYCAQRLTSQCPDDLRILSLLTLECPDEGHELVAMARDLPDQAELESDAFRIEILPPLDRVSLQDLRTYFRLERSRCPTDRAREAADLIHRRTKGRFAPTIELIDRGDDLEWSDSFFADLRSDAHAGDATT